MVVCLQRHCVTSSSVSPSVHRNMNRNMSAPSSPVYTELTESRMFSLHANGSDSLHQQKPSLPCAIAAHIHSSVSDNGGRYTDKHHSDAKRDSERSRVDRNYSNYAYIQASAVNRPQMKDEVLDLRGGRVGGVRSDGVYSQLHWPGHRVERPREVAGPVNNTHRLDDNLYHIATNRTMSYASSDELQSAVPVTATATASRFLDPAPRWPTKYGSLEGAYRRQNGDVGNVNLSSGCLRRGSSPYAGSETSLPDRSHDTMPRRLASPPVHYETPPHLRAAATDASCDSIELSPADASPIVQRGQNAVEVSKPFEMADVYKYSARMRRTAADGAGDLRSTSSPHLTSHTRDQLPPYIDPNPQYLPTRHYWKPVFDS